MSERMNLSAKDKNLERTMGSKGRWRNFPNYQEDVKQLTSSSALKVVDRITIDRFVYPKTPQLINKTATFVVDTDLYRFSDDLEKDKDLMQLHPFGKTWAGNVHSRIGGIDFFHDYKVWVAKDHKARYSGQVSHIIVHAESKPQPLEAHLLQRMVTTALKITVNFDKCEITANQFNGQGAGPEAVDSLNKSGGVWTWLTNVIPYFRMIRAPLLFRLWPQKQLLKLKYNDFCKLSDAVENGKLRPVCFAFSWLTPCADLDELDLSHMTTLQYALNCPNTNELILCEFFQHALQLAKVAGHTYSTIEQLVKYYAGMKTYGPPPVFNLNSLFKLPTNKPYHEPHLLDSMRKLLSEAVGYKIIKMVYHQECPKAIYAMDDYTKQDYVARFINILFEKRWKRDIHTDGCKTQTDVFAKIMAKRASPNAHLPGVPQWDNTEFQKHFATLDMEQRQAVANCVLKPVIVVSGPPGSGKTKTGQTIYYLFGGGEAVLPLAPYGRIASMWRDLLDDRGYTYHRSVSMVKYQRGNPEAQAFKKSNEWELDEYGLITHHHLYMAFKAYGHSLLRIVFFGDPNQKGAIGSGNFGSSLYFNTRNRPEIASHLALPHRFAKPGTLPDSIRDYVWIRPTARDSMSIAWNMREILAYDVNSDNEERRCLDLVYTTDVSDLAAKFILAPRLYSRTEGTKDMDGLKKTLEPIFRAVLGDNVLGTGEQCVDMINEKGMQVLIQRNADRKAVNEAVFQLAFGTNTDKTTRAFYPHERLTFIKNKYYIRSEDDTKAVVESVTDRELEHVNILDAGIMADDQVIVGSIDQILREAAMDRELGVTAEREKKQATSRKRKRRPDDYTDSDDVFNGEIRQLMQIVDVDEKTDKVIETVEHTNSKNYTGRSDKKVSKKRILEFNTLKGERKILNITDGYDVDEIERAYCLTAAKMQGSEDKVVIYIVTPSQYSSYGGVINTLFNEELYTVITRGKIRLYLVAGRDEREGLAEIKTVAGVHAERPRNVLGSLIKFDAVPLEDAMDIDEKDEENEDEEKD